MCLRQSGQSFPSDQHLVQKLRLQHSVNDSSGVNGICPSKQREKKSFDSRAGESIFLCIPHCPSLDANMEARALTDSCSHPITSGENNLQMELTLH